MRPSDPAAGLAGITLAGIVVTNPDLRVTAAGAVASFTVATHERRFDPATGQCLDTGTTLLPCSIGHQAAENVAASLTTGTRVLITGVLRQREWETTAGHKRYAYEIHATEIAVSLNYATAQVTPTERGKK